MRVLSILQFSPPSKLCGGAERQMHSIHKGLVSKGIDVQVLADFSNVGQAYQVFEGVTIWGIRFPILPPNILRLSMIQSWVRLKRILRLINNNIGQVDLIQVTPIREVAVWGFWLSRALNVPWVGRVACSGSYGDFGYMNKYMSRNIFVKRLIPELLRSCSRVIALDQETYQEVLINGLSKDKVIIISNAVVFEQIPSNKKAKEIPEGGILLFLGRIAPQKRVTDIVKAYAILKQNAGTNCKRKLPLLKIVGGGNIEGLENLVNSLGIQSSVEVVGYRENVEPFLQKAIAIINASETEGMPNSVMEACAYGVPSILSSIPIHREIASRTGMIEFLFPVGDIKVLSEKIGNYLSMKTEDMIQKRNQCYEYAQGFTRENRDLAYLNLYTQIIEGFPAQYKEF
ncbi:MAG: glycosyltransferase family 4 protein [Syntrophaceae bacterium]|nr:glycosyltransferase family 4 protein [Syntrophaceae bacterium]